MLNFFHRITLDKESYDHRRDGNVNQKKLFEDLQITKAEEMAGKTYSFIYANRLEVVATVTHVSVHRNMAIFRGNNDWVVLDSTHFRRGGVSIDGLSSVKEIPHNYEPLTVSYNNAQEVDIYDIKSFEDAGIGFGDNVILEFSTTKPYLVFAVNKVDKENVPFIYDNLLHVITSGPGADLHRLLIKKIEQKPIYQQKFQNTNKPYSTK